jgi:hypothetical protein
MIEKKIGFIFSSSLVIRFYVPGFLGFKIYLLALPTPD